MTSHFQDAINILNTNVHEEIQPSLLTGASHEDALMMNVSIALQHLAQGLQDEFLEIRNRLTRLETALRQS